MDKIILTIATFPVIASIGAFYYYSDESLLLRVIGILVALGVYVVIALQSAPGKIAWAFLGDARTEIRKVVWPTRKETAQTTMFVLIAVFVMGIALWLLDMFLRWAIRFLTTA